MIPTNNHANYTKLLKDVTPSVLSSISNLFNATFPSVNSSQSLYDIFIAMWRYYEICEEDESMFLQMVTDTYNENKDYFKELYDNYTKQYDYALGNKRVMERHDASHSEGTFDGDVTDDKTTSDYDLPNKVVSETSADGYMTGKTVDGSHQIVDNENSKDSTYDSVITHTYDNEFLDLKKKYLAQIRNVYREFAEKFDVCFYHLFS